MKSNISKELSSAIKNGDKNRIHTLRLILAAIKDKDGDLVIICTYAELEVSKAKIHKPKLVYFKKNTNIIDTIKSKISEQRKGKIINL